MVRNDPQKNEGKYDGNSENIPKFPQNTVVRNALANVKFTADPTPNATL